MIGTEMTARLAQWEWIHLECSLRCELASAVRWPHILALRPRILHAARELVEMGVFLPGEIPPLFDPQLPDDPETRKRFQKPAPPFVFRYDPATMRPYRRGERFRFELLLFGRAIPRCGAMLQVVERLAGGGFGDEGAFELDEVHGWDDSGNRHPVWCAGDDFDELAPPVRSADWWLNRVAPSGGALRLNFTTPARLMAGGRPLFRPTFAEIFPFLLRRVTAQCYHHAGVLLVDDVQPLLEAAGAVSAVSELHWEDWRELPVGVDLEVGGFMGSCVLQGERLAEIAWLLPLAGLLQVGRGAAYGAGKFDLLTTEAG